MGHDRGRLGLGIVAAPLASWSQEAGLERAMLLLFDTGLWMMINAVFAVRRLRCGRAKERTS